MKSSSYPVALALIFTLLLVNLTAFAQESAYDLLVKKDGTIMEVKIVEIKPDEILYRKKDDPDGAIFGIGKSELLSAKLSNGETLTFTVTVDSFYDKTRAASYPARQSGVPLYEAIPPKNEFESGIQALPSDQLENKYHLYRAASRAGKAKGWTGTILQIGVNLIGTIIAVANTETDSFGNTYYTNEKAVRTAGFLMVGGTLSGLILGPAGFVKAAKNGNKARYIRDEMRRRGVSYQPRR